MLTVVERFDSSEFILVRYHEIREFVEEGCPFGSGNVETPCTLESLPCSLYGRIDVLWGRLGNFCDELSGG